MNSEIIKAAANNDAESIVEEVSEKENTTKENSGKIETRKRILKSLVVVVFTAMSAVMALSGVFMLNSGGAMTKSSELTEVRTFLSDLESDVYNFKSDILSDIYNIPKVYILPWSEDPAPVPDQSCYKYEAGNSNPVGYEDETIKVEYWTERHLDSNFHFAKVTIAHPTQLRTAFAGGKYGTKTRYNPDIIAQNVNAVIATNADFYNYRIGGVLVRQGVLYRNKPQNWDVLLIDDKGDFHIYYDNDPMVQTLIDSGTIVNTLHFGPSLVVNGEIKIMHPESGCGKDWNMDQVSPRTAIGQLGELTYLMCCVEGRMEDSWGVKTPAMAQIMLDKGCVQAYLLDGGRSTTMVFNGISINRPLWGGMRTVSDIVYFATAIDE